LSVPNEALADWQLSRFRDRPENSGRACRDGWWRYSWHPNYFFEWLHWWTYVALGVRAPGWWVNVTAPTLMLFFILRVTGIGPTEQQALSRRGEDYRDYQRTTSVFIPWPPRGRTGNGRD
jgi:steroid 5-alpha reductase family enzyme